MRSVCVFILRRHPTTKITPKKKINKYKNNNNNTNIILFIKSFIIRLPCKRWEEKKTNGEMLTVCERASRSIVWKLRCARAKRMRKFLELMRYVSTAPQSREIIARSFDGSVCYPSATERVFSQWSLIHIRLVRNVCVCVCQSMLIGPGRVHTSVAKTMEPFM